MKHLSKEQLDKLKKELEKEKEDILEELKSVKSSLKNTSQRDLDGDNSYSEDFADLGTSTFERERDLSIYENLKSTLSNINQSFKAMEEGSYGLCVRCGKEISYKRLSAIPFAELCLECKKKEETE